MSKNKPKKYKSGASDSLSISALSKNSDKIIGKGGIEIKVAKVSVMPDPSKYMVTSDLTNVYGMTRNIVNNQFCKGRTVEKHFTEILKYFNKRYVKKSEAEEFIKAYTGSDPVLKNRHKIALPHNGISEGAIWVHISDAAAAKAEEEARKRGMDSFDFVSKLFDEKIREVLKYVPADAATKTTKKRSGKAQGR